MTAGTDRATYLALSELERRYAAAAEPGHARTLTASELRCFSQNGEDGVIAEILGRIGTREQFFVEFGIESGREGNCVFLADVRSWRGLFIEADAEHFRRLSGKYAANPRLAVLNAVVTAENIESLLERGGVPAEPDVLSIDIDGADYWVWEAISAYRPHVVVVEYNPALGVRERRVQPRSHREGWNGTDLFGASLPALEELATRKQYRLVHTELAACNAFFVRADLIGDLFPPAKEVVRWGYPNYFLQGIEHPHDPGIADFVDPVPAIAGAPQDGAAAGTRPDLAYPLRDGPAQRRFPRFSAAVRRVRRIRSHRSPHRGVDD